MRFLPNSPLALLLLIGFAQAGYSGGEYKDLLRRLPDTTNVVMTANMPALRQAFGLPPGTAVAAPEAHCAPITSDQLVLGAKVDLSEQRHVWTIALAHLARKMTIQDIAKAEGEEVEEVAGYSVVPSPRNVFFIDLGQDLIAAGSPADRQRLKRWLTYQKTNQVVALSPYLVEAVDSADPALFVLALDLADSFSPTAIHRGLNNSQVLAARKNTNYEAVAKTLARMKGLTFTVKPGIPLTGELTVDFNTTTEEVRGFAKSFLIEVLQHMQVSLSEFDDWRPRLKETSVGIYGPLSLNGMRRIVSLIRTPAPAPEAANMKAYQSMDPAQRAATASQRYYKSVTQLLADLKNDKTRSVKGQAGWYDKYSGQIDKLPILDVDPMLIQYGADMSEHLRAMGASLNGISLQSGYLQKQKTVGQIYQAPYFTGNYNYYNGYGGYYGGWGANLANNVALYRSGTAGGTTTVDNFDQIRSIQDALVLQGNAARVQLWQRIDNETAEVRRQMTQKYRVEF
jgi:hypothetical protein